MRYFIILLIILSFKICKCNDYIWPILDCRAGKGIIYKPQDIIGDELNFSNLFITAKLGADVIAPESGKIVFYSYTYLQSLTYSFSLPVDIVKAIEDPNYDIEQRELLAKKFQTKPKFISLIIMIETDTGERYSIVGLRPTKYFKTGSKIKKGDIIGKVGYVYNKISDPTISFALSKNSKPIDPLRVFGLATTFISPKANKNQKDYLTVLHNPTELNEDFKVFCNSLIEGHPGLYDYISPEELNQKINETKNELTKSMTSEEFSLKLAKIIAIIKDSHTTIYPVKYKSSDGSLPPILYGLNNDNVVIYSAFRGYNDYVNKKIISIDNQKIEDILFEINSILYGSDGYINTVKERKLFLWLWKYYGMLTNKSKKDTISIEFSNRTTKKFIYDNYDAKNYVPFVKKPFNEDVKILCTSLTSDIAFIKINSFNLNEVEGITIRNFIHHISDSLYKGLIIDVRDNLGGSSLDEIYSYIAQKPWRVTLFNKVNKKGTYELFKHSINYLPDMKLFQNYIKPEDGNSFVFPKDSFLINYPNDSINFKGKVVVIVNEFSLSLATLFPALVHKQNRGKIIGRETGSGYYQMNGIHFPKIELKNTGLELFFPLVQAVFDEKGKSDIPWGRGVIPDIYVPLNMEEFMGSKDSCLELAIQYINSDQSKWKNGKYFFYILMSLLIILFICINGIKRLLTKK